MITYELTYLVRIDGHKVGRIKQTNCGGWQYWPDRGKLGGEVFATLEACKKSLEG